MAYKRMKSPPIPVARVDDTIFVVRVSKTMLRLAKLTDDGDGYYLGYTNIRRLEFITEPFRYSALPNMLSEHGESKPTLWESV